MRYCWVKPSIESFLKFFGEVSAVAPASGDNKIYGNWVFMGVGEGFTFFIIR